MHGTRRTAAPSRHRGRGGTHPLALLARAAALPLALSLSLVACSNPRAVLPPSVPASSKPVSGNASVVTGSAGSRPPIVGVEPWTFGAEQGRIIRTPSYRLFTNLPANITIDRLPLFMETALNGYRSIYAALPAPLLALDTFLLATRPQWMKLTSQMFPDEAEGFLRIPRGGFTLNSRAVLYDLGTHDTLALIGHEGWHQFTQQTFADPLPIWLEEGIATHMEGFRWEAADPTRPVFLPWANPERFDQLRLALTLARLTPLSELLDDSPQELIASSASVGDAHAALMYYAQVWALVHFLNEGEAGIYRAPLAALITDASRGNLVGSIRRAMGERAASSYTLRRRGAGLFKIYFNADLAAAQDQYTAFIERITRVGGRDKAVAGRSPLSAPVSE